MQIDWACDTAAVIDADTDEIISSYVLVATLPYSDYSYVTMGPLNLGGPIAQFHRVRLFCSGPAPIMHKLICQFSVSISAHIFTYCNLLKDGVL